MPKKSDELDSILSKPSYDELDLILQGKPKDTETQAHLDKAKAFEAERDAYKSKDGPGAFKAGVIAAGKGMTDMYRGIGSRIGQGLEKIGFMKEGTVNSYLQGVNEEHKTFKRLQSQHPIATMVGEAIGEAAALPVPPVVKAGALGAGVLGAAGRGAINMGLAGAAFGAADVENADKSMLQAAAEGAGPAAAVGGVLGGAGKLAQKTISSILKPSNAIPEQQILSEVAQQTGLKPTFGEIAQSPTAQSAEGFLGSLPLNKMRSYKFESAASIEPSIGKFTNQMAGKWADVPETSFISHLKGMESAAASKADDLYKAAATAAKAEKLVPNPEPIKSFLTEQISLYKDLPGKDSKRLVNELTDQLGHVKNLTYDKIDQNVKYLTKLAFKKFKQAEAGNALPDEYKVYYKLRDTYLDALDSPKASVNVKAAMNSARNFYKTEVVPFHDPKLQQYMGQEIAMDKWMRSMTDVAKAGGKPGIFEKMGQEEQQLLRKDFLGFVRQEATKADGTLDVNKFLGKLNQFSALKPHIFGDQTKKFEAYTKLLGYIQPDKDLGNTGMMMGSTLGSIGAAIGAATVPATKAVLLPAAAVLWGFSRMSANPTGRTILGNLTRATDKTSPVLRNALETKGRAMLNNILKTIPPLYIKNTGINIMREIDENRPRRKPNNVPRSPWVNVTGVRG